MAYIESSCTKQILRFVVTVSGLLIFSSVAECGLGFVNLNGRTQENKLSFRHMSPVTFVDKRGRTSDNFRLATAKALVDRYESSIVAPRQVAGIFDLASQLTESKIYNIEDYLIKAAREYSLTPENGYSPPASFIGKIDLGGEDYGLIGDGYQTDNRIVNNLNKAEESLDTVTEKVISLGKGLLTTASVLTGLSSKLLGAIYVPVTKTIKQLVKDRHISRCSKLSLSTALREIPKLEYLIRNNQNLTASNLDYSLAILDSSLNLFHCYVRVRSDDSNQLTSLNQQLSAIYMSIHSLEREIEEFSHGDLKNQVFALRGKLGELFSNRLVVTMSDNDLSLQMFTAAQQRLTKDIVDIANINTSDKASYKLQCQAVLESSKLLIDELRNLGTSVVDKIIQTARSITNSFEDIAGMAANGLARLNSYKEMYEQLLLASKGFQNPNLILN